MNIHLPAILGFTRYQGFDPSPFEDVDRVCEPFFEEPVFAGEAPNETSSLLGGRGRGLYGLP